MYNVVVAVAADNACWDISLNLFPKARTPTQPLEVQDVNILLVYRLNLKNGKHNCRMHTKSKSTDGYNNKSNQTVQFQQEFQFELRTHSLDL